MIIDGTEDKGGDFTPDVVDHNKEADRFDILNHLLPTNKRDKKIEMITSASAVLLMCRKCISRL